MRIKNVRINGMENPTGFDFGTVCVSWKVREASGKEQQNVTSLVTAYKIENTVADYLYESIGVK